MLPFIQLTDSKQYSKTFHPDIWKELQRYPDLCTVSGNIYKISASGVLFSNGTPVIVFPKTYIPDNNTDEEIIAGAKILVRTLLRYRSEAPSSPKEMPFLHGSGEMSSSRLVCAFRILEDYVQNGLIRREVRKITKGYSGEVLWNRTVKESVPFMSSGRPVYTNPISRKKFPDNRDPLILIHRHILEDCISTWGWLYDKKVNVESIRIPWSEDEMCRILRNELRHNFVDREIRLIKSMIIYLEKKKEQSSDKKLEIIATPYYAFVWERICGFLFDNIYENVKDILPQPEWISTTLHGGISQRPDIFFLENGNLYILDAKYYDLSKGLPGWHDTVKQFFYRYTMQQVVNDQNVIQKMSTIKRIFNGFLSPGNNKDIDLVGRVRVDRVESLGEIFAFTINQQQAAKAYATRDKSSFAKIMQKKLIDLFSGNINNKML